MSRYELEDLREYGIIVGHGRVREQYADTGGFTDHVFAACSILGYLAADGSRLGSEPKAKAAGRLEPSGFDGIAATQVQSSPAEPHRAADTHLIGEVERNLSASMVPSCRP